MKTESRETKIEARFLKDIAGHQMTVHIADGIYRHLTFRRPDTFIYGFHITTWTGFLCISGDMGTYVFSRLPDMFDFFRGNAINPSYWAEKLTADAKHGGHRSFSEERYRKALGEDFSHWTFDSDEDRKRAWEALEDDFSGIMHASTAEEAFRRASEWKCHISGRGFTDFWRHDLEEYSVQFLWCCHAIQWAIARFDETATAPTEPVSA